MGRDEKSGATVRAACLTLNVTDAPGLAGAHPFGSIDVLFDSRAEDKWDRQEQTPVRRRQRVLGQSAKLHHVGVTSTAICMVRGAGLRRLRVIALAWRSTVGRTVFVRVMAQMERRRRLLVRAVPGQCCSGKLGWQSEQKDHE